MSKSVKRTEWKQIADMTYIAVVNGHSIAVTITRGENWECFKDDVLVASVRGERSYAMAVAELAAGKLRF